MSVNLSGRQFQDPGLLDQIRRILRETGLEPRALKLEITDSVLMLDAESTAARMRALTEIGVRFAIDDFGTGYSSLSYLRRFPVDTLKIDRSFVEGLGEEREKSAIVRATIALARALGLTVTAEGIENATQLRRLLALQCDLGQGFHFALPLEPDAMTALLAERHQYQLPARANTRHRATKAA